MKPTAKDYLSIALALLAIFLCGYGIGFLLGERKGQRNQAPPSAPSSQQPRTFDWDSWQRTTIQSIEDSIDDLSPEQRQAIRHEVSETAKRIMEARQSGRREFQNLDKRLKQHLTPEQEAKLPGTSPD
tara:strand:- start:94 stop:477 length:384 start_codon:yes stop_codon:yes gene_type:complete